MRRNTQSKILGGVLSGIGESLSVSAGLLRIIFLIGFFAIGGITFGITSAAMALIYILFWIFIPSK